MPHLRAMAFMEAFQRAFERGRAAGDMDAALSRWQKRHPSLRFFTATDLVAFLQDPDERLKPQKEKTLRALTTRAKAKDETAGTVLVGLFLPLFRRTRKEVGDSLLSDEELEAEMLAGFWEEVVRSHPLEESISARLFYAVQNRAWKAVREASRVACLPLDKKFEAAEAPSTLGLGDDPAEVVQRARAEGTLSSAQAELIMRVRLEAKSIEELASAQGISPEALRMRLSRAEGKLGRWLQPNEDETQQPGASHRSA